MRANSLPKRRDINESNDSSSSASGGRFFLRNGSLSTAGMTVKAKLDRRKPSVFEGIVVSPDEFGLSGI